MRHSFRIDGGLIAAALAGHGPTRRLLLGDCTYTVRCEEAGEGVFDIWIDDAYSRAYLAASAGRALVHIGGDTFEVEVLDPVSAHLHRGEIAGGLDVHAPMPGSVVAVCVRAGDMVKEGDTVLVIESMKLEVALRASGAGVVRTIAYAVGETFEKDAVLAQLAGAEFS